MKFGPVPVEQAEGAILGHNIVDSGGRRILRKGRALQGEDLAALAALGRDSVYVAILEPGDVDENSAAERITRAIAGAGVLLKGPSTGRVNTHAAALGVVRVEVERLLLLNQRQGVTVATMSNGSVAAEGKMVATTKILPYAVDPETVAQIEQEARSEGSVVSVSELARRRAALIVFASPSSEEKVVSGFESALRNRLEAWGSVLESPEFVALDDQTGTGDLASRLSSLVERGAELVLLAGETAIQDRHDLAPAALERAGGELVCFGAPVDPGNLFMLGYLGEVPVVGAPGCARSPKTNIVDLVLPRLLTGERLTEHDIVRLGHGGLLEDVPERPLPRRTV